MVCLPEKRLATPCGARVSPTQPEMQTEAQKYRQAWVEHLMQQEWSHSFDLTTRFPYTSEALYQEFERFLRRLSRATQRPIRAFLALEQTTTGHLHAHALLGCTEALKADHLKRSWRSGFSRPAVLRDATEAARYATKWAPANEETYRTYGRDELWRRPQ